MGSKISVNGSVLPSFMNVYLLLFSINVSNVYEVWSENLKHLYLETKLSVNCIILIYLLLLEGVLTHFRNGILDRSSWKWPLFCVGGTFLSKVPDSPRVANIQLEAFNHHPLVCFCHLTTPKVPISPCCAFSPALFCKVTSNVQ